MENTRLGVTKFLLLFELFLFFFLCFLLFFFFVGRVGWGSVKPQKEETEGLQRVPQRQRSRRYRADYCAGPRLFSVGCKAIQKRVPPTNNRIVTNYNFCSFFTVIL